MAFIHQQQPDIQELDTTYVDGKRFYVTPDGKHYPSVTTVVSLYSQQFIQQWRERVGEEVADRISTQASNRGTAVHKLFEDYINNDPDFKKGHMPNNIESFNVLKPVLDEKLNNVVMQEVPLYSHFLRVGGRVDCIAEWEGRLSVIDFKTSKRPKSKSQIKGYFMQASAYCVMFEELTGIPIDQIVIAITVDDMKPQVFIENRDNYIDGFIELREQYKQQNDV